MREYGSEFDCAIIERGSLRAYFDRFCGKAFVRCGREAIGLCAAKIARETGLRVVYMPALSCHSMWQPFADAGFEIRFYPIDEAFLPRPTIAKGERAVLFVMLYYGATDLDYVRSVVRAYPDCVTVADVTHSCFDAAAYDTGCDYTVISMRKSIGIVNGGVALSAKRELEQPAYEPNAFTQLRRKAFDEKLRYGVCKSAECKQNYRAMFAAAEHEIDAATRIVGADAQSVAQFADCDVAQIASARKANYRALYRAIERIDGVQPLTPPDLADRGAPFSLPIAVRDRDAVQRRLAQRGVYAPVLWPLADAARATDAFAAKVEREMLSLPIDQRYAYDDMSDIGAILREALS